MHMWPCRDVLSALSFGVGGVVQATVGDVISVYVTQPTLTVSVDTESGFSMALLTNSTQGFMAGLSTNLPFGSGSWFITLSTYTTWLTIQDPQWAAGTGLLSNGSYVVSQSGYYLTHVNLALAIASVATLYSTSLLVYTASSLADYPCATIYGPLGFGGGSACIVCACIDFSHCMQLRHSSSAALCTCRRGRSCPWLSAPAPRPSRWPRCAAMCCMRVVVMMQCSRTRAGRWPRWPITTGASTTASLSASSLR